jgi:hypothetical protein
MRGRGSANTDEFIREVDEAVRQEQWLKLWKQYGSYLVAAVLAVAIGTAAGVGWRTWQQRERLDEARRYAAAQQMLSDDRPAEAAEAFAALAEDASSGYRVLARLRAAEARAAAGDPAAATALLEQLAANDDAEPRYRSLGGLLAAQRAVVNADPGALLADLELLIGTNDPWRHSALELRALAHMRSGDTAAARRTLDDLLDDPLTPPDLARRAAELLAFLGGPPQTDATEEALPEEPPPQEPRADQTEEGAVAEGD